MQVLGRSSQKSPAELTNRGRRCSRRDFQKTINSPAPLLRQRTTTHRNPQLHRLALHTSPSRPTLVQLDRHRAFIALRNTSTSTANTTYSEKKKNLAACARAVAKHSAPQQRGHPKQPEWDLCQPCSCTFVRLSPAAARRVDGSCLRGRPTYSSNNGIS